MLRGRRLYAEKPSAYARLAARAFSGVGSAARGDFEGVLEQGENRGQALFRGAAAAGKVDDERAASEPSHGAREPGEGILLGAQGAHVGQDDFSVADARWRAGRALAGEVTLPIIGKSTHSLAQAMAAETEGADYIGFGPLFATPTKPGRPAIGLDEIRKAHERARIPIFCIGGIKLENLEAVIAAGARRVVIVSGLLQAADLAGYARRVKAMLRDAPRPNA